MGRRLVLLLLVGAVLAGSAPTVSAAPSDVKVSVGAKAQFVTPTTLLLPLTYVCPTSFVTAVVSAGVSQEETGAFGSGALPSVPCTGAAETVVITVNAVKGPFTLGQAVASGFMVTGFQGDSQLRRIQIVL